jgi:para-nitrobenzyl esterase
MVTRNVLPFFCIALFAIGCSSGPGAEDDTDGAQGGAGSGSGGHTADSNGAGGGGGGGCPTTAAAEPGVVITNRGAVRGALSGNTYAFKGVPYAAPPTGQLRFKPPTEAACWSEVRDATEFGAECPQYEDRRFSGSEDCLTLNVWAPVAARQGSLPVLVFVHGGGNAQGSSAIAMYDGGWLAEHQPGGVVVVTLNYRLGPLGFLAHPALSAESEQHASGNYGILDQIAALEWVQGNIAAFGGDPARVLLFGESAGAADAGVLLASPLAAGLFTSVAMESGRVGDSWFVPLEEAEQGGLSIADAAGCTDPTAAAQCLRDLTPQGALLAAVGHYGSGFAPPGHKLYPNIDGYVLTANPIDAMKSGSHNHVPVVVGANRDEMTYFYLEGEGPPVTNEVEYEAALSTTFGADNVSAILAHYPADNYPTPLGAFIAATSDANFICHARRVGRALHEGQNEPVYRYLFTQGLAVGPSAWAGAFHSLELLFLFHSFDKYRYPANPSELALADAMSTYWTRLASGDPNGPGATDWPGDDPDAYLLLEDPISSSAAPVGQCDFWDTTWQP